MTAFLKIDDCSSCHRPLPWEWVPAVLLAGKPLAGTGVWRSQLTAGRCSACQAAVETERKNEERSQVVRRDLVQLLGGEKPYREFTFELYRVTPGNRLAYERCKGFDPSATNLYIWGSCGVGKTHLAWASARRCFEDKLSVEILRPWQLSRSVRMREPEQEQAAIDEIVNNQMLVVDDFGTGSDTAFSRLLFQELLERRDFIDRAGLIVTSKYSLESLAEKMGDDTIPSRLAGLCDVVEIRGIDCRLVTDHYRAGNTSSQT